MSIVGGLDIHRKQITFDYVELETGRFERGQICPADREHVARWLSRFDGMSGVAFAMEGCTGWRYVAEELRNAGIEPHLAEPAETSALRGPKRRAKTDKADARLQRERLAAGRLPECYIPPSQVLEWRALLELYHDLRAEHTGWAQRVHATCFHQGTTAVGEAGVIRGSRERLESIVAEQLSPVGRLQVNTALSIMDTLARASGPAAPAAGGHGPARVRSACAHGRHLRGGADDLVGVVRLAGRGGPVLLLPQGGPVRGAGHHRALLRFQTQPGPAVPAGSGGAAVAAVRGGQDLRSQLRPRLQLLHRCEGARYDANRAALSQARRLVRQAVHVLTDLGDDAFTVIAQPAAPTMVAR